QCQAPPVAEQRRPIGPQFGSRRVECAEKDQGAECTLQPASLPCKNSAGKEGAIDHPWYDRSETFGRRVTERNAAQVCQFATGQRQEGAERQEYEAKRRVREPRCHRRPQ